MPDAKVTLDLTEEQALVLLAEGFDKAESHPACIRFHRHNETLTLWDSEPDHGRSWEMEVAADATIDPAWNHPILPDPSDPNWENYVVVSQPNPDDTRSPTEGPHDD